MPVLISGTAVVIRNDALDRCLEGGAERFASIAPNAMSFGDGEISQASFMSSRDAEFFRDQLVLMGLRIDDETPDLTVVDAFHQTMTPSCDWLVLREYKGSVIASMVGNESDVVVAPESWNPDAGPSLQHMSPEEVKERLEFVRREERVDVYRDKQTGKLLYSARIFETPDELFRKAAKIVFSNLRHPGHPPPTEQQQDEVREAIGILQQLASLKNDAWRIWFLLGKAWHAVDRIERSIASFQRAMELSDETETVICKELAGVLLENGDTEQACDVAEKAVSTSPDNVELLGNLAIAYLLDGRIETALKTVQYAIALDPNEPTNNFIGAKIQAVADDRIPCPTNLSQLEDLGADQDSDAEG